MIDVDRVAEIVARAHSYYRSQAPAYRNDDRLNPSVRAFLGGQVTRDMAVLDIGCGDAGTLIELAPLIEQGVGIDHDPDHVKLGLDGIAAAGVTNIDIHEVGIDQLPAMGWDERFDLVFSERGPIGFDSWSVQAGMSVLALNGLLFCETIGDLHHQEVREVFGSGVRFNRMIRASEQVRVAMERNGLDIRIAADLISKRVYPDVYEWLQFQCSIWAWTGVPLPDPADPRIRIFEAKNTTDAGEIETTHHVVWVGGVKLAQRPGYREVQHFG